MCADLQKTAASLVAALSQKQLTCALAESCTGGMAASAITDVPGASAVFVGGAVTYTNACKAILADVKSSTITEFSAVSPQVAAAMAAGIRAKLGADLAGAVTGNAGPAPSEGQPVGTVYFAVSSSWYSQVVKLPQPPENATRAQIRQLAADALLRLMQDCVEH